MSEELESVRVEIVQGPLPAMASCGGSAGGAWLCFEGMVRPLEDGKPIAGLFYEIYRPMAERQLRVLGTELVGQHGLLDMHIAHSFGWVPAGSCSFRLAISSSRRAEAFAAMQEFIDRMKRDIPIWKKPCQTPPQDL